MVAGLPDAPAAIESVTTKASVFLEQHTIHTSTHVQIRGAFDSAKNHKRQRRKRQSVTAKREKSQTPKFV